jgi:molybdopterin/thiamine biosynthesis adenylyltransferase
MTDNEKKRYARQVMLEEIGETGQVKLKNSKVLVVGAGGLGSAVLYYLAAAGIGTIGFLDIDNVELSNLQRQILYSSDDIGTIKVDSAKEKLAKLNLDIVLKPYKEKLTKENTIDFICDYDVIVDATDDFSTRLDLNEGCIRLGKPLVHGGVSGFYGQVMTVIPGAGPCLNCIYGEDPNLMIFSQSSGVFGAIAGTIGTIEAVEAVKIILNIGDGLIGRLMVYDALRGSFEQVRVIRNPKCQVCGSVS